MAGKELEAGTVKGRYDWDTRVRAVEALKAQGLSDGDVRKGLAKIFNVETYYGITHLQLQCDEVNEKLRQFAGPYGLALFKAALARVIK